MATAGVMGVSPVDLSAMVLPDVIDMIDAWNAAHGGGASAPVPLSEEECRALGLEGFD